MIVVYVVFLSELIYTIFILGSIKCPDMKAVKLGKSMCGYDSSAADLIWIEYFWDEGQKCLSGCIRWMNENELEEACCQAELSGNKLDTHCMVREKVDVVEPGFSSSKAVKCKGTLKHV